MSRLFPRCLPLAALLACGAHLAAAEFTLVNKTSFDLFIVQEYPFPELRVSTSDAQDPSLTLPELALGQDGVRLRSGCRSTLRLARPEPATPTAAFQLRGGVRMPSIINVLLDFREDSPRAVGFSLAAWDRSALEPRVVVIDREVVILDPDMAERPAAPAVDGGTVPFPSSRDPRGRGLGPSAPEPGSARSGGSRRPRENARADAGGGKRARLHHEPSAVRAAPEPSPAPAAAAPALPEALKGAPSPSWPFAAAAAAGSAPSVPGYPASAALGKSPAAPLTCSAPAAAASAPGEPVLLRSAAAPPALALLPVQATAVPAAPAAAASLFAPPGVPPVHEESQVVDISATIFNTSATMPWYLSSRGDLQVECSATMDCPGSSSQGIYHRGYPARIEIPPAGRVHLYLMPSPGEPNTVFSLLDHLRTNPLDCALTLAAAGSSLSLTPRWKDLAVTYGERENHYVIAMDAWAPPVPTKAKETPAGSAAAHRP